MDIKPGVVGEVPEALRNLVAEPELALAWEHQVAARRAEAAKTTALLDYQDRVIAFYCEDPTVMRYQAEKAALRDAAALLGISELTTQSTLGAARFARNYLPATWRAFTSGRIDMLRVRKIADVGCEVEDHLLSRVDHAAAEKAATGRTISEFQRWLTRWVAQADYEAYDRLCTSKRQGRYIQFFHGSDGMSHIDARLPTIEAAAIQKRLTITARRHHGAPQASPARIPKSDADIGPAEPRHSEGEDLKEHTDDRTVAQREADLFSAWLRTGDTPEEGASAVEAKIMVMVPEAALTGASQEPATAADRSWRLPADHARRLAGDPEAQHEWYEGWTRSDAREADVDVLSVSYTGRYPPARLRDALIFRDGTCQATGCSVPAERCDLDHQLPWDAGGETAGTNLWALCRRHHRLKSHGFLHPPGDHPQGQRASPEKESSPKSPQAPLPTVDIVWAFHTYTLTA